MKIFIINSRFVSLSVYYFIYWYFLFRNYKNNQKTFKNCCTYTSLPKSVIHHISPKKRSAPKNRSPLKGTNFNNMKKNDICEMSIIELTTDEVKEHNDIHEMSIIEFPNDEVKEHIIYYNIVSCNVY